MTWGLLAVGIVVAMLTIPGVVRINHWTLLFPSFAVSWLGTGLAGWWMVVVSAVAATLVALGALESIEGWVGLALVLVCLAGLVVQWLVARRAGRAFDATLHPLDGLPYKAARRTARSILLPMWLRDERVERFKNIRYADGSKRRHLLDVYRPRAGTTHAPVLLQIHGGAWMIGSKDTQGRPLMNALANAGWVCVAINYRLSPKAKFPDHLVDCKLAIRWIRQHIAEHGGDPRSIVVTGGSAGGHLASMVALTANDPELQTDFPEIDTSVKACVSMYGAYELARVFDRSPSRLARRVASRLGRTVLGSDLDDLGPYREASPMYRVAPGAPPFLVVHGSIDNLVPVEQARQFVGELAKAGGQVAYVELRGAPHAFDVFHSTWADASVVGVIRYLTWVLESADPTERPGAVGSSATGPRTTVRTAPS
jgi:acetyl esterase/lipase